MVPIWSRQESLTTHAGQLFPTLCWRDSWAQSSDINPPWDAPAAPSPTLSPSRGCPSSLQASCPSPERKGGSRLKGKEGSFPFRNGLLFRIRHSKQFLPGQERVSGGNQVAKCDGHSIFTRVLLAVPSGCLPSQAVQEWHLQLPRKAMWGCVAETAAAIYRGPYHQRKKCPAAAGRGKSPRQCVRIMWGLGKRHGWGWGSHWQDHAGRTTDGMKSQPSLLFLQGHHTDGQHAKIFQSLKAWAKRYHISMIQEARIFSRFQSQSLLQLWSTPHICFTGYLWTVERWSIHSQERHFPTPTARTMKALAARCYHLPIYYFTCQVMHPLVMTKWSSGFQFHTSCWHHPLGFFACPFKNLCAFLCEICGSTCCFGEVLGQVPDSGQGSMKPSRCLCCRWHSGLAQPRPSPGLCLPSPCSWRCRPSAET